MTRLRLSVLAVALGALMAPLAAAPKPSNTLATVTLADRVGDKFLSDGGGAYVNGQGCVQSWFALPKGNFFLRTVNSQTSCVELEARHIVIDLSDRVWPSSPCASPNPVSDRYSNVIDVCGSNDVPDVRMVADRLFSASATALIVPFSLQKDFRYTAFELDFVETLSVTGTGTTRTMTAGADAVAELWQIDGRTKTLIGRYLMPLSATVSPAAP